MCILGAAGCMRLGQSRPFSWSEAGACEVVPRSVIPVDISNDSSPLDQYAVLSECIDSLTRMAQGEG